MPRISLKRLVALCFACLLCCASALAEPKIARMAEGVDLVKSIVVKGRLVNLIFKPKA